jgi:hypothetical protein
MDSRTIKQTIYEFSGGRVTKISNINEANIVARTDEFTYDNSGRLSKHVLKDIEIGGTGPLGSYSFENTFYYGNTSTHELSSLGEMGGAVTLVVQKRCTPLGCYDGFFSRGVPGSSGYSAKAFYSAIPATLVSYSPTQGYQYTWDNNAVSTFSAVFSNDQTTMLRRPSWNTSFPFGLNEIYNPGTTAFNLPISYTDDPYTEHDKDSFDIKIEFGNSEYLLHLYYAVAEWINPDRGTPPSDYTMYNDGYERGYQRDLTYGLENSWWIIPRLIMPIECSNYWTAGFVFNNTKPSFKVSFVNEVVLKK